MRSVELTNRGPPQPDHVSDPEDRFSYLDDVRRSWLLRRTEQHVGSRNIRARRLSLCLVVTVLCIIAVPLIITKAVPKHKSLPPVPDNYSVALHKALLFFNAQKSGRLPRSNGISWRGDSGLKDGFDKLKTGLVGGYYNSGINIKCHFPMSFSMTMLSWSVLEYEHKYRSTGEYDHMRDLIKWGTDYILLLFDSNSSSIGRVYSQVGSRIGGLTTPNDESCWERPEDMDYKRLVRTAYSAPDLGGEMAASLAAASIVFNDDADYSTKLINAARTVFAFAQDTSRQIPYSWYMEADASYNSTGFWDEHVWGATWLYYATGDLGYLTLATDPKLAKRAKSSSPVPNLWVFSWDNKLPAAMLLLTMVRLFLDPGYPYEENLSNYHKTIERTMCSYLRNFSVFNYTRGGLIKLNYGDEEPFQYTVNTAFLASLYTDYLKAADVPGWFCGDTFFPRETLKKFASSQIQYILGENPMNMSYVVGYGSKFARHVHHRGASIPNNGVKYSCTDGYKWRDNPNPNPNIINGALMGGTDKFDKFYDVRGNRTYTEPTLAGNAGLVAALVSLT